MFHFGFLEKVQIWTKNSIHYSFSPPAELKNPKFHFIFLEKVQIWTENLTHYPFSPPAEFTKK